MLFVDAELYLGWKELDHHISTAYWSTDKLHEQRQQQWEASYQAGKTGLSRQSPGQSPTQLLATPTARRPSNATFREGQTTFGR